MVITPENDLKICHKSINGLYIEEAVLRNSKQLSLGRRQFHNMNQSVNKSEDLNVAIDQLDTLHRILSFVGGKKQQMKGVRR